MSHSYAPPDVSFGHDALQSVAELEKGIDLEARDQMENMTEVDIQSVLRCKEQRLLTRAMRLNL